MRHHSTFHWSGQIPSIPLLGLPAHVHIWLWWGSCHIRQYGWGSLMIGAGAYWTYLVKIVLGLVGQIQVRYVVVCVVYAK